MLTSLLWRAASEPHSDLSDDKGFAQEVLFEQSAIPGTARPGETQMGCKRDGQLVMETDRLENRVLSRAAA